MSEGGGEVVKGGVVRGMGRVGEQLGSSETREEGT